MPRGSTPAPVLARLAQLTIAGLTSFRCPEAPPSDKGLARAFYPELYPDSSVWDLVCARTKFHNVTFKDPQGKKPTQLKFPNRVASPLEMHGAMNDNRTVASSVASNLIRMRRDESRGSRWVSQSSSYGPG